MQRAEQCKKIIRQFERNVEQLYKKAWEQVDELYDDEYEQHLSYPWLKQLNDEFDFGFKRNRLE